MPLQNATRAPQTPLDYAALRAPIQAMIRDKAYQRALAGLMDLVKLFPTDPFLLDDMALCYWHLRDHDTALKLLDLIVANHPNDAAAWSKLGAMCLSVGDPDRAAAAFSQSLKLKPKSPSTLAALNRIKGFSRDSHRTNMLRKLSKSKGIDRAGRVTAFNTLGQIEESAGNFQRAFRLFEKAKALTPGKHIPDAFDRHVAAQHQLFDGAKALDQTDDGPRYIFVVGLPRSGTTLVETILSQHPDVDTIGESPALQNALTTCRAQVGKIHGAQTGWDWYRHITPDQITALRAQYIAQTTAPFIGPTPKVIIDKLPLNCLELGFANLILPQARFIFMARHPLDVGLSNFVTNFHDTLAFTKRLDWIGQMTRAVYASFDDYQIKLGDTLRRQSYRALVEQPDQQIRALLDHAHLDWHDACLTPQTGTQVIRTASITQVRAPINTKALEKWHRYKADLSPLISALGGQDWIDKWVADDIAPLDAAPHSHYL